MRLSRRDELLLHLSEQPRELSEVMPRASTQRGISEDLDLHPATISIVLADLEMQKLVDTGKAHVDGFPYRVRCYCLAPAAEPHVKAALLRLQAAELEADRVPSVEVSVTIKGGR